MTKKERIRRFAEQERNDPDEYGCSYYFTRIRQFQRMQMQMEYNQGLLWLLYMSFNSSYVLLSTSLCSPSPSSLNIWHGFSCCDVFSYISSLGKGPATKSDDFLEKFQTAFDPPPPPHFWKIMLQIFYKGYGRIYARR